MTPDSEHSKRGADTPDQRAKPWREWAFRDIDRQQNAFLTRPGYDWCPLALLTINRDCCAGQPMKDGLPSCATPPPELGGSGETAPE